MRVKGPWSAQEIEGFLAATVIPMRLAVVTSQGDPLVLSLWFLPLDGALWCACNRHAQTARILRANPRCAFEIAGDRPPYRGVRGKGSTSLHDDKGPDVLARLMTRYGIGATTRLGRFLTLRAGDETAVRIVPRSLMSWDFTERMTD